MTKKTLLLLLLILFITLPVMGATVRYGYFRSVLNFTRQPDTLNSGALNKLRYYFESQYGDYLGSRIALDFKTFNGNQDKPAPDQDFLSLYRAAGTIHLPGTDVTLGKQRIAWGTGTVWDPTDLFYSFRLIDPEEDVPGVLGIRIERPLSTFTGIDIYAVSQNADLNTFVSALKYRGNFRLLNYSLIYAYNGFTDRQIWGMDFRQDFDGGKLYGEATCTVPKTAGQYLKLVLGSNYTFLGGLNLNLEYYFNGAGAVQPVNYAWNQFAGISTPLARDYVFVRTIKAITQDILFTNNLIFNLNDGGFLLYPVSNWIIEDGIELNFEGLFFFGNKGSEFNPTLTQDPAGKSNYNSAYAKFKFAF